MYKYIYELDIKSYNGHFFDFISKSSLPIFTDYQCLDREIILINYGNGIKLGEKKRRTKISNIEELTRNVKNLILDVVKIYSENNMGFSITHIGEEKQSLCRLPIYSYYIDHNKLRIDLLVQQVIFDLLFDKYLSEAKKITCSLYSKQISEMLYVDRIQRISASESIVKRLKRAMEGYHLKAKNSSKLKKNLIELGVDPDKFEQYYSPKLKENLNKKKPKIVWDFLFYNQNMITYRQYRRELKKDGNYPYEQFIMDLNDYNNFVMKLLPKDNESPMKYFNMSMEYYFLEAYKRIDFMGMLITSMPKLGISEIDREHFLVKRFHPKVLLPYEKNNELYFTEKCKYYRPLFLLEEAFKKEQEESNSLNHSNYAIKLLNHQIVRAKAYELFKYHYEYISSDYSDIKSFILQSYNMLSYHNANELWPIIKGKSWNDFDCTTKRFLKLFLRNFVSINRAFFWDLPKEK